MRSAHGSHRCAPAACRYLSRSSRRSDATTAGGNNDRRASVELPGCYHDRASSSGLSPAVVVALRDELPRVGPHRGEWRRGGRDAVGSSSGRRACTPMRPFRSTAVQIFRPQPDRAGVANKQPGSAAAAPLELSRSFLVGACPLESSRADLVAMRGASTVGGSDLAVEAYKTQVTIVPCQTIAPPQGTSAGQYGLTFP